jgi:ABC-type uncharacterized transport system ATPase component
MVSHDKLTVLMVTHDRDLAAQFADRTIQMRDGQVVTSDEGQESSDE